MSDNILPKTWDILSPFIAAFLASITTYFFSVRTKKTEILLDGKHRAFEQILKSLVAIETFAGARYCDLIGKNYKPQTKDLPDDQRKSPREHQVEWDSVLAAHSIYFIANSTTGLKKISWHLKDICTEESRISDQSPADTSELERTYFNLMCDSSSMARQLHTCLGLSPMNKKV